MDLRLVVSIINLSFTTAEGFDVVSPAIHHYTVLCPNYLWSTFRERLNLFKNANNLTVTIDTQKVMTCLLRAHSSVIIKRNYSETFREAFLMV